MADGRAAVAATAWRVPKGPLDAVSGLRLWVRKHSALGFSYGSRSRPWQDLEVIESFSIAPRLPGQYVSLGDVWEQNQAAPFG